jgi:hypothetical protein
VLAVEAGALATFLLSDRESIFGGTLAIGVLLAQVGFMWAALRWGTIQRQPWLSDGDPAITADPFGLTVVWPSGRRRRYEWPDIADIQEHTLMPPQPGGRASRWWFAETRGGFAFRYAAGSASAERLTRTLRRIREAACEGRAWDASVRPEVGLSRVTADEGYAERGLSHVDA